MGAERGGEMAAGGESPDADAVGVDAVLGGMGADEAHGAAAVVDLDRIAVGRDTIVEDEGGHALLVEPGGDLEAFVAHGDMLIASTWNDENGGTGGAGFRQQGIHAGLVGFSGAEGARGSVGVARAFIEIDGGRDGGSGLSVKLRSER